MTKQTVRAALLLGALLGSGLLKAGDIGEPKKEPVLWKPVLPLQAPDLANGLPADAAGCVLVGHHVLADGTTAKPRIMQGAFTAGLDDAAKAQFQSAALAASTRWRFEFIGKDDVALPAFNTEAVGFMPAADGTALTSIVGTDRQDGRVRDACRMDDLAEWGDRHSISIADAQANADPRVLVVAKGAPPTLWTVRGELTPPRYPENAARSGIEACIVVGIVIGSDGVPTSFRVMTATTTDNRKASIKPFEDAALYAASGWRFSPGPDNAARLQEFRQMPVDFRLRPSKSRFSCEVVEL